MPYLIGSPQTHQFLEIQGFKLRWVLMGVKGGWRRAVVRWEAVVLGVSRQWCWGLPAIDSSSGARNEWVRAYACWERVWTQRGVGLRSPKYGCKQGNVKGEILYVTVVVGRSGNPVWVWGEVLPVLKVVVLVVGFRAQGDNGMRDKGRVKLRTHKFH